MNDPEYHKMFALEDTHWWFVAKRYFLQAVLPPPSSCLKIIDLGAGTGGLTQFLTKWGEVTAVEQSVIAQKYLKRRNLKVVSTKIQHIPKKFSMTYDLVMLCDVLYHQLIDDDMRILEIAYSLLKPHGMILITDSALQLLYSHHDTVMHTRHRYTKAELLRKLSASGFMIKRSSYIYFFIFPITVMTRLFNKLFPFENVGPVHPVLNALFGGLCRAEATLLRYISFPVGSSVLILAEKV